MNVNSNRCIIIKWYYLAFHSRLMGFNYFRVTRGMSFIKESWVQTGSRTATMNTFLTKSWQRNEEIIIEPKISYHS